MIELTGIEAPETPASGKAILYVDSADGQMKAILDDGTVCAFAEAAIEKSIVTAKGDLIAGAAAVTPGRLPIGTNGQILVCDSAEALGVKWIDIPAQEFVKVGGLYITEAVYADSAAVAAALGFGTWGAYGAGRTLVGLDSGDTAFDTTGETGGAKTVAAAGSNAAENAHTHPTHTHSEDHASAGEDIWTVRSGTLSAHGAGSSHNHAFTGSATSVVQPYIVVYFWKRTA